MCHHEAESCQAITGWIFCLAAQKPKFDTEKNVKIINRILSWLTQDGDIILDSFAGSGTTGHAVFDTNKNDGGKRKFIIIEALEAVSRNITAPRLSKLSLEKGEGFRYCRLGVPLFNEFGDIDGEVSFPDLAAHVFFAETGAPIPSKAQPGKAYLGKHGNKAVYLLFAQGQQGFPREALGNMLTPAALAALPPVPAGFEGTRIVYAEGTTVSADRLKAAGVTFKQIPYQIAGL